MSRHPDRDPKAGTTDCGRRPPELAGGWRGDGPGSKLRNGKNMTITPNVMLSGERRYGADAGPSSPGDLHQSRDRSPVAPLSAEPLRSVATGGRKPTICHLLDRSDVSEAEALAVQITRQLGSRYKFMFVTLGDPGPLVKGLGLEETSVHTVARRQGLDWKCTQRLGRLLQREGVDLLHAHQSGAFVHGIVARLFYQRPPVLFTAHERRSCDTPSPRRVVGNQLLLEARDRVVAASQAVRQALIQVDGLPPERVGVIYSGIVPPPASCTASDVQSVRREIGVDDNALMILQPANFEPRQNHTLSIRTLEHVVRNLPEARLVLVGRGPDREMIQELARQRGLGSHVLFLEPCDDLTRLLMAADLILLTGLCEGVPPVLIQALAAGRPVVAMRVGGVSEIVEDRLCGLLACPGDYGGLADRILRLGASPELRDQFGRQGRKRLESLSSEASTPLLYSNLYSSMLPH